jgi:peptidoglycan/LPS O-acetylase OafA/YrhL
VPPSPTAQVETESVSESATRASLHRRSPETGRGHLPALDGLRGLAIIAVMLYHGFLGLRWRVAWHQGIFGWTQAGWLGVDIFFVLSGFLITGILLDTKAASGYFRNFYARRFLRIIPVYYLILAIVFFVLPWFIPFNTPGLKTIQHRQLWLWTHLTNIGFVFNRKAWATSDWLGMSHFWSLAVEEQFYFAWPLVVFFLGRRQLKLACLGIVVFSFGLRLALWNADPRGGAMYFPTPCRLDGLAIGALTAILLRDKTFSASFARLARAGAVIAAAALLTLVAIRGGLFQTDKPALAFGIPAISILTAAGIAWIAKPRAAGPLTALLNNRFLRFSGKYSYGLYLFHGMLRTAMDVVTPSGWLIRWTGSDLAGNMLFVGLFIATSYALALLSWHAWEKHWLKLKNRFEYERAPRFSESARPVITSA